jgi:hypothetical protein
LATYGRLPSDFDESTAMGLAQNIPMIEARQSLVFAQGIAIAFGSPELTEHTIRMATGNSDLAFRVRMSMEHQKAATL